MGSFWDHGQTWGVQGLRKRSGPVGGKNRIPAGGFGVTRVTAMEDPPRKEENAALAGVGGLSGVGGLMVEKPNVRRFGGT